MTSELTWQDIREILIIADLLLSNDPEADLEKWPHEKDYYTEVLEEFKKTKSTQKDEDPWQSHRHAARTLNAQNLGIQFYGNIFPYLRRKGALKGYCKLGKRGKQKVWLYDTEGIAMLVKSGELNYNPNKPK